ncbi:MAG: hypothetical protein U0587_21400 [Candidatus Binatia bacterium]
MPGRLRDEGTAIAGGANAIGRAAALRFVDDGAASVGEECHAASASIGADLGR